MKKCFFIILLIASSCFKKDTEIPQGVLTHDQMVRVLIDVHILESKIKKLYLSKDSSQVVYDHYESLLFSDLNITRETYQNSMEFYMDEINQFKSIYDEVSDSLLARTKSQNIN